MSKLKFVVSFVKKNKKLMFCKGLGLKK